MEGEEDDAEEEEDEADGEKSFFTAFSLYSRC